MPGEILADGDSPMIMTVNQYNDRVAYIWKLATEAEQERIIKLLEEVIGERQQVEQTTWVQNEISNLNYLIELINGEANG